MKFNKATLLLSLSVLITLFMHISCSKKNAFSTTNNDNDNNNITNPIGNLLISPSPATYSDIIKITSLSTKTKFTATDLEVFFISTTSSIRYDIDIASITILSGTPDTILFPVPLDLPMDGYMVKIVYNKTNDTLMLNGYAILDADAIKNTVIVTKLSPNSVDISNNTEITISGNNFSSTNTDDTVTLLKDGKELYRWNGADFMSATTTGISFKIPQITSLIADIKTQGVYDIKLNVKGKNSAQTSLLPLTITNSKYPTFTYAYESVGTNAGTHIKLNNNNEYNLYHIDNPTNIIKTSATNTNDFYIPNDIASGDYFIQVKQADGGFVTALNADNIQDRIIPVRPYITKIEAAMFDGSTLNLPIDYPNTFADANTINIKVSGANLLNNSKTSAFELVASPEFTTTPTATTLDNQSIEYQKLSEHTQAGNITLTCNNAEGTNSASFAFYRPIVTGFPGGTLELVSISPNDLREFTIEGRGLNGNTILHLKNTTIDQEHSVTPTINPDGKSLSFLVTNINPQLLLGNAYDISTEVNGIRSTTLVRIRTTNTNVPEISEMHTITYTQSYVDLDIKGINLEGVSTIRILQSGSPTITPTILDKSSNSIKIRLESPTRFTGNPVIALTYGTDAGSSDEIFRFACIKAVNLITAQTNSLSFNFISSLLITGSRISIYGDGLNELHREDGFSIEFTNIAFGNISSNTVTLTSSNRVNANSVMTCPVIQNSETPKGTATLTIGATAAAPYKITVDIPIN